MMVSQYKHPDKNNHSYHYAGLNPPQASLRQFSIDRNLSQLSEHINTTEGGVELVQHRDIEDPDYAGTYTVKTYHSEKIEEDDVLVNQRIMLKPETNAYGYAPIVIENGGEEFVIVGEFLVVL